MALVRKRNYNKFILYAAVSAGVIIGGYLIYNSFLSGGDGDQIINTNTMGGVPIIDNFNEEFFNGEKYQSLRDYAQDSLPLQFNDIERGRDNPFELPL